jgi:Transglycosylase SLT domain
VHHATVVALGWVGLFGSAPVGAEVRNQPCDHGVIEFTNRRPAAAPSPAAAVPGRTLSSRDSSRRSDGFAAGGGTFWMRDRPDGVVEFTNIQPTTGARWRVWLKAGPGKASALRGASDVVPPRDRTVERYSRYDFHIQDQQLYYGIPEALVRAVIKTESDFDPHVVSSAGAQGLMQLMPETARLMGVTDSFDPRQNIMGGARYLQVLARRFCRTPASLSAPSGPLAGAVVCSNDEQVKVIAAYHAGPGAVERYGGLPPYETTRSYVTMVLRRYEAYRRVMTPSH